MIKLCSFALSWILIPALAFAQAQYAWTVSESNVDPLDRIGEPSGSFENLFLWFYCGSEGMSAADITLQSDPPGKILAFTTTNGFLNAGNATSLLLAVGGCPNGPIVAGNILVDHTAPLRICLTGFNVTVDCSLDPSAWPHEWAGYADTGLTPCASGGNIFCEGEPQAGACCHPDGTCELTLQAGCDGEWHSAMDCSQVDCKTVSVEDNSWGRIKAIYR